MSESFIYRPSYTSPGICALGPGESKKEGNEAAEIQRKTTADKVSQQTTPTNSHEGASLRTSPMT